MQNIKILAYRFLLEAQIKELNIPLGRLEEALKRQEIILLDYSNSFTIKNRIPEDVWPLVEEAMASNEGISVLCDDLTFILCSDELSYGRKIHTICHELGHITAGHKRTGSYNFEENKEHEREAEAFAYYVTAPPCVLNEIGGVSAETIAKLTGLNAELANEALRFIEKDKNESLVAEEKELLHQFETYIHINRTNPKPIKGLHIRTAAACAVTLAVIVTLMWTLSTIKTNGMLATATLPSAATQTEPPEAEMTSVWKSKTGDIYHTDPNCYHINKTAFKMKLSNAITAGYRKCKNCK